MTDDQNNMETNIDTNQNEEATEKQPPQIEDTDEADSIQKPAKRGRPALSQKQKENLAKGRAISRRNMQKRMAEEKLRKIEQEEKSVKAIETVHTEPQKKVKPTVNKKKPKKKIVIQSDSDSSEDEIIYVSKKKKKKPKKKVYISSSSEDESGNSSDDSSDMSPPQQVVRQQHYIQQPRLIFR